MKKFPLFLGFSLSLLSLVALAAAFEYSDSAASSVKIYKNAEGQVVQATRTVSYSVARDYSVSESKPVLLKKVLDEKYIENTEGSTGQLTLTARVTGRNAYDTQAYKIQEEANGAEFMGDGILLTWKTGCCDSATTYRAFNFQNGKKLFSYDDHTGETLGAYTTPFVIEVPNTPLKRFIGVLTESATRDFSMGELNGLRKVASIAYANEDGLVKSFDVYAKIPENYGSQAVASLVDLTDARKNEFRANRFTLWTSDGNKNPAEALQGFGLKITIYLENTTEIVIPFKGDAPDLSAVNLPEGFMLKGTN